MSTPMPNMTSPLAANGPLRANDQESPQRASVSEASGGSPSAAPMNGMPQMQEMQKMLLQTVQDMFKQMHGMGKDGQLKASPGSAPTLIPNDPHADMKLHTPKDAFTLNAMGKEGILSQLHALGGPWADVVDAQFKLESGHHQSPDELESPEAMARETHVPERRLRLVFETVASEQAARDRAAEACSALELSPNCRMIPQRYHVHVVGYVKVKGNDTREYLDMWCRDLHEVDVVDHFWTYRKLILSFSNIHDAKKLCERGVTIRQKAYTVQPFDRRAVPKFCFKCFLPGHFKPECTSETYKCGRCAEPHDVQTCPKGTQKKCPNCSEPHEAWSSECKHPDTLTWRAKAKAHLNRGPDWSRDPHQFATPQQAAKPAAEGEAPKGRKGKSSKRPAPDAPDSTAKKQLTAPIFAKEFRSGPATTKKQKQSGRSLSMPLGFASFQGSAPMQFQGQNGNGSTVATNLTGERSWRHITMGA